MIKTDKLNIILALLEELRDSGRHPIAIEPLIQAVKEEIEINLKLTLKSPTLENSWSIPVGAMLPMFNEFEIKILHNEFPTIAKRVKLTKGYAPETVELELKGLDGKFHTVELNVGQFFWRYK